MSPIRHAARAVASPRDPRRGRGERGATFIEAALVVPFFVMMVMALADLGIGIFQTSQATSAAADGARAGIIWDEDAEDVDVVGSPENDRVAEAVSGRLIGQEHQFKAECVDDTGEVIGCASADPETDRLRVTVTWVFEPFSPTGHAVAGNLDIRAEATMALIRQPDGLAAAPAPIPTTTTSTTTTTTTAPTTTTPAPTTTAPPTTAPGPTTPPPPTTTTTAPAPTTTTPPPTTTPAVCAVSGMVWQPSPIRINGSDKTIGSTTVRVTTNGAACGTVAVRINGITITTTGGPVYVGTLPKGSSLAVGANTVVVTSNGTAIHTDVTEAKK